MEILLEVLAAALVAIIGVASRYFIAWVQAKTAEIKINTENDSVDKYLDILERTITSCTLATTQTYVEALKKEGRFTPEAQKAAFASTFDAIMLILTDEAKDALRTVFTDLEGYISNRIEAEVNINK